MFEIYESFLNSTKKKVLPYIMTGITLLGVPTLTSCIKESSQEDTSFSEEYFDKINNALNSEDSKIIYNKEQDNYIIDYNIYMYDIHDPSSKKLIENVNLIIPGPIARAYGYEELLNSKIKTR